MTNKYETENDSDEGENKITFHEYLQFIYEGYTIPKAGMPILNYIKLHQKMFEDLKESDPKMIKIWKRIGSFDECYYWLEQTIIQTKKIAMQDNTQSLVYVYSNDDYRIGWQKTKVLYKRKK